MSNDVATVNVGEVEVEVDDVEVCALTARPRTMIRERRWWITMVESILEDGEEKGRETGRDGELREAGFGDVYRSLMVSD